MNIERIRRALNDWLNVDRLEKDHLGNIDWNNPANLDHCLVFLHGKKEKALDEFSECQCCICEIREHKYLDKIEFKKE